MMIFPMQPRVQHAILFRLIFLFLGGVTSGTIIYINEYNSTDPIEIGQDVMFTGTLNDTITPLGVSCFVNISNSSTPIKICDINARNCNGSADITCNCERQDGSIYHIVIKDPAKLERSYASFYCVGSVGSPSPLQTYPEIKEPPTTVTVPSTSITTTLGTTNTIGTAETKFDQPEKTTILGIGFFFIILSISLCTFLVWTLTKKRIKEEKKESKDDIQTDQVEADAIDETGLDPDPVANDPSLESSSLSISVDPPTSESGSGLED